MNTTKSKANNWSRREFLGNTGALVVSFALPIPGNAQTGATAWPTTIPPEMLDSWLAVRSDGSVLASIGKVEVGMGIGTSFAQIIAEELDVPLQRVALHMGDTATTVDQRGTGSSNGIITGGPVMKTAGAQARQALVAMAAQRLNVPPEQLTVNDGVVSVVSDPTRAVTYGELIGGKHFDLQVSDKVKFKPASQYKIVGKPVARMDIPAKMVGAYAYMVDHKLPGMLHGRVIRPPEAGAHLLGVAANQSFPGLVKVVTRGDFVAVVCQREEQAVRVARDLRVNWSKPAPMFAGSYDELYQSLRSATPKISKVVMNTGDTQAALGAAAKRVDVQYEFPFQSHSSMGPGCSVADVRPDGATVWMGGQKPYGLRNAIAKLLNLKSEQVRITWLPGPGSYGMNDSDDVAIDAALLSHAVGRPVRVQYSRADGTEWDPKAPPITMHMRGGLDASGKMVAYDMEARGYSGRVRSSGTDVPGDSLSGQLIGGMPAGGTDEFQHSEENYQFPNKRKVSHLVPWEKSLATGLRTSHLRDPDGPATCFASESFIDEMAFAAGQDPVEFRLAHLNETRDREVIKAAAQRAGWDTRPAPKPAQKGPVVTGRGIAYSPRSGTMVAIVAEVEVNLDTGRFRVTRFVVAHDCGFVINPKSLAGTIEANLIHAMSRAMHEEVRFTPSRVTSVDWASYPIVDMTEVPDVVDIVIVNNRPQAKSLGAGEPTTRPVLAVIANALFDATGVRIRRVPFTATSLLAAFRARA